MITEANYRFQKFTNSKLYKKVDLIPKTKAEIVKSSFQLSHINKYDTIQDRFLNNECQ